MIEALNSALADVVATEHAIAAVVVAVVVFLCLVGVFLRLVRLV